MACKLCDVFSVHLAILSAAKLAGVQTVQMVLVVANRFLYIPRPAKNK